VDACKAECAIANDGAIYSCSYTYRHDEIIGANFNPWWDITGGSEGVNKCRSSDDCGCPTSDDWGGDQEGGHDGDCLASACILGCDLANDPELQDGSFHGEDVVIGLPTVPVPVPVPVPAPVPLPVPIPVPVATPTPNTKTLEDYIASRTGCTDSCNTSC
jgi:hypothetical protein